MFRHCGQITVQWCPDTAHRSSSCGVQTSEGKHAVVFKTPWCEGIFVPEYCGQASGVRCGVQIRPWVDEGNIRMGDGARILTIDSDF